jgi:hypothetical protein
MQKKLKSAFSQGLKILFSVGIIAWLITSGRLDFNSLSKLLNPIYLIPGVLCAGLSLAFGTERWRFFLKSQNLLISFADALKLNLIGSFFNFAVPGGVGGDLVKGYYITQSSPHAKLSAAITVLVDRLIGLLAMSLLASIMMIYRWDLVGAQKELKFIFYIVALINLGSFFVWAHIFSHRLNSLGYVEKILSVLPKGETLIRTYQTLTKYRHSKEVFFPTLFLSFASQLTAVLFFIFAGKGLGYTDVPLSTYFVAVPIAFMIQSIPLSPAGVGVGQAASFFLFNLLSPGAGPLGATTTTAYQIVQFMFGLCGAYFYLGISKKLKNSSPATPQTEENR